MNEVQVLVLNDNNHGSTFALRGKVFDNVIDFMNHCLVKPHQSEFKIRSVSIGDNDVDYNSFELVGTSPEKLHNEQFLLRQKAFTTLWELADKECFYV